MQSYPDLQNDHLIEKKNLSLISLCGRVLYKVGQSLLSMESPYNQGNEDCLVPLQNV